MFRASLKYIFTTSLILSISLNPLRAYSQTLAIGRTLYQKGDVLGAEKALKKALNSANVKQEKARILVMLGIVDFTIGNRQGAINNFKTALSYDPQVNINPQDALDPAVRSVFQKAKADSVQTSSPPALPQSSQGNKANASVALAPGAKPAKKTLLKILSKNPDAQVSIDGILAGSVNELINTDPGKVLVEISAPGFQAMRTYVEVIENKENVVSVTLEKIRPNPKPQPTQDQNLVESEPTVVPVPSTGRSKKNLKRPKQKQQNDDIKQAKPRQQNDDLFESAERPQRKSKKPTRDYAREFEMDASAGAMPTYPPPYPVQPSPYPPQGYNYGYAPPAPVYTPPPAYSPPPTYPPEPSYPPPPPDREKSGSYLEPKQKVSATSLLPLGIGQFAQKRYILGIAFLVSEVGLGYMYYNLGEENAEFAESVNSYLKEFCTPGPNEKLEDEAIAECSTYQEESQTYLKEKKGQQQLYLLGAIGIGIAGIVEAILWDSSDHAPASPSPPKKKRSKSRKYRGFSLKINPHAITQNSPSFSDFHLLPPEKMMMHYPPLALQWRWTF